MTSSEKHAADEMERHATTRTIGPLGEIVHYLWNNKKWWLTPIFLVLLLVGALIALMMTPLAPFIYPLF